MTRKYVKSGKFRKPGNLPLGRPSEYTPEIGTEICELIILGRSMPEIVNTPGMPDERTIYRWVLGRGSELESFCRDYARARIFSANAIYHQIVEVERCMQLKPERTDRKYKDGRFIFEPHPDHIDAQVGRVLIDSMRWRAGRMNPRMYGDHTQIEQTTKIEFSIADNAPGWLKQLHRPAQDVVIAAPQPPPIIEGEAVHIE